MQNTPIHARRIFPELVRQLENNKILILTGSRQVGKTTLMHMLRNSLLEGTPSMFVDLDVASNRELFSSYEQALDYLRLNGYRENGERFFCFLDEFHQVSGIGKVLKNLYDHHRNLKIVASGSSSLTIVSTIKESLAGRKFIFHVHPLDFEEYLAFTGDLQAKIQYANVHTLQQPSVEWPAILERHLAQFITYGGYPEVVLTLLPADKELVLGSIFDLYLEKDMLGFARIENLSAFRKLVLLLAVQHGQQVNYSALSRETGLHTQTVKHYLYLLEQTFVIALVRPYSGGDKREIVKAPKVYFLDHGVRNYFLGTFSGGFMRADIGVVWGGYVLQEILKQSDTTALRYWRTKQGQEVDFVLGREMLVPVEVKRTSTNPMREMGGVRAFMERYGVSRGFVLSQNGNFTRTVEQGVVSFVPAINFAGRLSAS
jgi:uncharacterized protein